MSERALPVDPVRRHAPPTAAAPTGSWATEWKPSPRPEPLRIDELRRRAGEQTYQPEPWQGPRALNAREGSNR